MREGREVSLPNLRPALHNTHREAGQTGLLGSAFTPCMSPSHTEHPHSRQCLGEAHHRQADLAVARPAAATVLASGKSTLTHGQEDEEQSVALRHGKPMLTERNWEALRHAQITEEKQNPDPLSAVPASRNPSPVQAKVLVFNSF